MPRYDARTKNPERYEKVRAEQAEMLKAISGTTRAVRLCPYCDKKISLLYPGYHGPEATKCDNCGEIIVFPAVKISRTVKA